MRMDHIAADRQPQLRAGVISEHARSIRVAFIGTSYGTTQRIAIWGTNYS